MCLRASGVTSAGGPHRRAEIDYPGSGPLGVTDMITLCAHRQAPTRGKGSQLSHSPVICKGDHYRQGIPMSQADSYSPQQFFLLSPWHSAATVPTGGPSLPSGVHYTLAVKVRGQEHHDAVVS